MGPVSIGFRSRRRAVCRNFPAGGCLQDFPAAPFPVIVFRPGVGFLRGDHRGLSRRNLLPIAGYIPGGNPGGPEQHRSQGREMDAVAPVRLFPEPTDKVRLPFRHLGCFQIVDGAPLHQSLDCGRIRGSRQDSLCPGQCAFRQGKIDFQGLLGKGAALAAVGEGIAGGAAGIRQGPTGEDGAGAGIVRKIDKVLHRKGFYGKGAFFLPPAVKVFGPGRICRPAPAGIGVKILAPEVYAAVFGGCHRQHRHPGLFSAGKGCQIPAPVHLGHEGIPGKHPGAAPEFRENRLPDRG